jgi:hypothetical protein
MRTHRKHLGLSLLLAGVTLAMSSPSRAATDDEINWLGDYREALRQARQTQKPMLVEFRCEA